MGDYEINLPADLQGLVEHWTAEGTMKFRWPTDNEHNFKHAGDQWGGYGVESELKRMNPEGAVNAVRQKNEGSAVDAFMDYWRNVPVRNINDLIDSFKIMSAALLAMNAALIAYKNAAISELTELKKELDENQKWAWLPWSDDDKINERAKSLVGSFDANIEYDLEDFNATMRNVTALVEEQKPLYETIRNRLTPDLEKAGEKLAG
jgi:hypothetical protein